MGRGLAVEKCEAESGMFHVELQHLPEYDEPAAQVFDERPGGFVDERRGDQRGSLRAGRGAEKQDPAAEPEKRLDAGEELLLHPHGPDADEILRFVQLGAGEQVLGA